MVMEQISNQMQKKREKLYLYVVFCIKVNSKLNIKLNVKPESINFWEKIYVLYLLLSYDTIQNFLAMLNTKSI